MTAETPINTDFHRFSSWSEIFPTSLAEELHFQGLVTDFLVEYNSNSIFESTLQTPGKFGKLAIIYRTDKAITTIAHIDGGNLSVTFSHPSHLDHVSTISARVGSREHMWTMSDVKRLKKGLLNYMDNSTDVYRNLEAATIHSYVRGNLATEREEQNLIAQDFVPLRIGYKIYPNRMLETAEAFLLNETS